MPDAPWPITRKKEEKEGGAASVAMLGPEEEGVVVVVVLQRERRRGRGEEVEGGTVREEGDAVARCRGSGEKTPEPGNAFALVPMLLPLLLLLLLPVRKRGEGGNAPGVPTKEGIIVTRTAALAGRGESRPGATPGNPCGHVPRSSTKSAASEVGLGKRQDKGGRGGDCCCAGRGGEERCGREGRMKEQDEKLLLLPLLLVVVFVMAMEEVDEEGGGAIIYCPSWSWFWLPVGESVGRRGKEGS